jgi:hypothetical protein
MVSTAQDIMDRYGIDQDFAASIESLGNDLGVDPMYLANTMYAESRLDPSIKNEAGSGATGLIQFMPGTAANLGTTTDELSRMTPVEQMEYVRRYFSVDNFGAGRLRDLRNDPSQHNVNMAVFLPSMIGKPLDTQIPQEYWRQNGSIRTPGDYTRSAEKRVNEYIQSNPVDTQPDPVDTQTDEMLSEEQPEDSFRPENDSVSSDTGTPVGDQNEEALEVDDTIISEHEEKIRRGEAPKGSKPTKEGGYYTEGKYGFKTNPEGEVVADLDVSSLENVVTSIGERLRTILGNNEDSPENLRKAEGGSVEKEVKFGKKDDDDDVPDPPPGATPEEVADDIPAYLSTGEYVLPANVVRYIGLKNIADMHRMALAELQQMEDLNIIENVDENGYVEDDDDETKYMEPEGVVEVIVAEHHPKGLMAMGFAQGGGVNDTGGYGGGVDDGGEDAPAGPDTGGYGGGVDDGSEDAPGLGASNPGFSGTDKSDVTDADVAAAIDRAGRDPGGVHAGYESVARDRLDRARRGDMSVGELAAYSRSGAMALDAAQVAGYSAERAVEEAGMTYDRADEPGFQGGDTRSGTGDPAGEGQGEKGNTPDDEEVDTDTEKLTDTDSLSDYTYVPGVGYRRTVKGVKPLSKLKYGGYVTRNGIMARGFAEGGMLNSDSLNGEEVLPTSDIFSKGVYAQANIDRSVGSDGVVESDKVITAPVAFSSAPGKTAYLAYITPEEAASLRQAKQGFSPEGSGQEVSPDQYQHIGPKGLMSFNGEGGAGPSDVGDPGGGPGEPPAEREPEVVEEEEKPTDLYEGYTYVNGIGYVPTSRRMTSDKPVESASLALLSIFPPSFLQTIGLMSDPNKEV